MFRPAASRVTLRAAPRLQRAGNARRFLSTAPPSEKRRSWKNSAVRWGLAAAGVYYYNTSDAFDEPSKRTIVAVPETDRESETHSTVDAIVAQRQSKRSDRAPAPPLSAEQHAPGEKVEQEPSGSPEALEEEADSQGAFNPETGEINWDCPCLGGMAHGPCGEEFKAAFSCFVYSKEEPKGVDCIEKFKGMQDCFRQHPDVYGAELEDDEDDVSLEGRPEAEGDSEPVPAGAAAASQGTHPLSEVVEEKKESS